MRSWYNRLPLSLLLSGLLLATAACAAAPVVADPAPILSSTPAPSTASASPVVAALPSATAVPPTLKPPPATSTVVPATPSLLPSPTAIPEIELLFTGDINPGRCVYAKAAAADDMALPYRPLADLLQSAEIAVGSLDGTLSDRDEPPPCAEFHRNLMGPSVMVEGLRFAGFDVITLATNHAKDCGLGRGCADESLIDTLTNLGRADIQPVGAGPDLAAAAQPVVVTVQGVRFAFVAFSAINGQLWADAAAAGTAPLKRDVYLAAIRAARERADVVVVLPHWGREYSPAITYEQFGAAGEMVAAGATLVVGNHPHRVQGVETFSNGAVVAYALGNFVFDQTWSDGTQYTIQGLMLKAVFRGATLDRVELLPIHIYDDFQPRLAEPEEAAIILREVENSMAQAPRRTKDE